MQFENYIYDVFATGNIAKNKKIPIGSLPRGTSCSIFRNDMCNRIVKRIAFTEISNCPFFKYIYFVHLFVKSTNRRTKWRRWEFKGLKLRFLTHSARARFCQRPDMILKKDWRKKPQFMSKNQETLTSFKTWPSVINLPLIVLARSWPISRLFLEGQQSNMPSFLLAKKKKNRRKSQYNYKPTL